MDRGAQAIAHHASQKGNPNGFQQGFHPSGAAEEMQGGFRTEYALRFSISKHASRRRRFVSLVIPQNGCRPAFETIDGIASCAGAWKNAPAARAPNFRAGLLVSMPLRTWIAPDRLPYRKRRRLRMADGYARVSSAPRHDRPERPCGDERLVVASCGSAEILDSACRSCCSGDPR